jgi:hypothetical protein
MRSMILSAVLGLGAMGLVGATPSQAKAYWPPAGVPYVYQVGPYGVMGGSLGNPNFRMMSGAGRYNMMYSYPGYYRMYNNPNGFGAVYTSPGSVGQAFSPFYVAYSYYSTPGYAGYSFNRFTGYRQFAVPGLTYATPSGYSPLMGFGGY